MDWLSRALARAGVLPLREAEEAIRAGRVRLGGRPTRQPMALVPPDAEIQLDGRRVSLAFTPRALAFHKPGGVVTAPEDPHGAGTVFERLQEVLAPSLRGFTWHAVGRLDRDTTGLLLFTNDERLVAHVTAPVSHLPKRYRARVQGTPTEQRLEPLRAGLVLPDGPTRPAEARVTGPHEVELTLTEGRHHQVKRMLGAVGLPVLALERRAIGRLELDIPPGAYRELGPAELQGKLGFTPLPTRRGAGHADF